MKTRFISLALLLCSSLTFAQTAFTKATLDGILKDYQKNPHDFFERSCPPDFRYIATDGSFKFLPELLKGSVNDKLLANEIQEPKIIQSGDVAVVSGIHVQERMAADGAKYLRRVACTYTFQRQKGNASAPRWLFVASQQSNITTASPGQTTGDEAAIKAVLEGHTQATLNKDAEKAISYFANSPNTAILYQLPGSGYIRGYQAVTDGYRKVLNADSSRKSPDNLTTGDYRYRIVGNTAFVTYIETQTAPDGAMSRTHKANYLEKDGNGSAARWKMIGNFWMPEMKAK